MVRVGSSAAAYGDPFDYSVTLKHAGAFVVIKGFTYPDVNREDFAFVIAAINRITGKLVAFERGSRWVFQLEKIQQGDKNVRFFALPKLLTRSFKDAVFMGLGEQSAAE